jgi:predicted pyridoxine 5'-phosphate oxidase superfamily flavin-nucleotide-binding protein
MSAIYRDSHRALQRQFDTERLADRIEQRLRHESITEDDRAFIERMDLFFLATADRDGQPSCSYKGGDPGFVRVLDEHTLVFPSYDGNGMFLSAGNLSENPRIGMLFIDLESPRRLRVNGSAGIVPAGSVEPRCQEAQFLIRVVVRELFPNCPRYIHKYQRIERSRFVPRAGVATPVPAWKQFEWARDVLPAGDPACASGPSDG